MDSLGRSNCNKASRNHQALIHACVCVQEAANEREEGSDAGDL